MKIFYLYAEIMGYTMATIRALVDTDAQIHIVHWDKGTAHVTRDNETFLLAENQSTFIPAGTKHRLKNTGKFRWG